ncbi:MAG: hypothetical protein P4L33_13255 [Capsulimonadaceae bacterium]|nr:hypothetical protein [Capsulimonadaceae bacterium]
MRLTKALPIVSISRTLAAGLVGTAIILGSPAQAGGLFSFKLPWQHAAPAPSAAPNTALSPHPGGPPVGPGGPGIHHHAGPGGPPMPANMAHRPRPGVSTAGKPGGVAPGKEAKEAEKSTKTAKVAEVLPKHRRHSARSSRALRARRLEAIRESAVTEYKANLLRSLQLPGAHLFDGRSERWAVKVGLDPEAKSVFRTFDEPVPQEVEDLATTPRVEGYENTTVRYEPYETTPWVVEGSIVAFGVAPDGDYVLVIKGGKPENLSPADEAAYNKLAGTHFTDTILAAIPDPSAIAPTSAWKSNIEVVRFQFDEEFAGERHPGTIMRRLLYPVKVRLTGVGFFDFDHGQEGRAPNVLTIHPVLKMEWLDDTAGKAAMQSTKP